MDMKHLLWVTLLFTAIVIFPVRLYADTKSDIENTISELQNKISELQGQESSLSKQISILNSNIELSNLKIAAIKGTIEKLTTEIEELNVQIEDLEKRKTRQLELVIHRTPESYKRSRIPLFGLLLFSSNFSDLLSRMKYLSSVQENDARSYRQLQLIQNNYNDRRDQREKKKTELESLKKQLENETRELNRQKREKQSLLEQTKSSEDVYQRLLAQALAEKQALERALVDAVAVGPVKKGEPIAIVGNTGYPGCSTGAHLHFEVRKNNSWVDPAGYLTSKSLIDDQDGGTITVGSGSWDWPLEDPIRLTQHFGKTPYSWRYAYSDGVHTGYDMVSTSSVIRAPSDGTLYSSNQVCGTGSIIKIKYIDHGEGVLSFYLHVQ